MYNPIRVFSQPSDFTGMVCLGVESELPSLPRNAPLMWNPDAEAEHSKILCYTMRDVPDTFLKKKGTICM